MRVDPRRKVTRIERRDRAHGHVVLKPTVGESHEIGQRLRRGLEIRRSRDSRDIVSHRVTKQTIGRDEQRSRGELAAESNWLAAGTHERLADLALGQIDDIVATDEPRAGVTAACSRDVARVDRKNHGGALPYRLELGVQCVEEAAPMLGRVAGSIDDRLRGACTITGTAGTIGERDDEPFAVLEHRGSILASSTCRHDPHRVNH